MLKVGVEGGGVGGSQVVALFLAEAATQMANSQAPLHKRFSKLLAARPQLDVQVTWQTS